jgi:hypothetical protein
MIWQSQQASHRSLITALQPQPFIYIVGNHRISHPIHCLGQEFGIGAARGQNIRHHGCPRPCLQIVAIQQRPYQQRHLPAVLDRRSHPRKLRKKMGWWHTRFVPHPAIHPPSSIEILGHPIADDPIKIQRQNRRQHAHKNKDPAIVTLNLQNFHLNLETGVQGFEPRNAWTKTRCLTAWRHPNTVTFANITRQDRSMSTLFWTFLGQRYSALSFGPRLNALGY